ncbi:hypothetical protein [Streptomyces californicus]|uniref:hypothetical protein n=1 Tax=Streptomyces californicus TaxID=67351 RepID=UPI00379D22CD
MNVALRHLLPAAPPPSLPPPSTSAHLSALPLASPDAPPHPYATGHDEASVR